MLPTVQARGRRRRAGVRNSSNIVLISICNFQGPGCYRDLATVLLVRPALHQKAMVVYPVRPQECYGSFSALAWERWLLCGKPLPDDISRGSLAGVSWHGRPCSSVPGICCYAAAGQLPAGYIRPPIRLFEAVALPSIPVAQPYADDWQAYARGCG